MNSKKMPPLRIGDLETRIPIIQGGMGVGVSLSGLASAVANAGGIGVIATAGIGMFEIDFFKNVNAANRSALRKEILKARKMTKGILGVNIMVALSDFDNLVDASVDCGIDIIFMGAGIPSYNPKVKPLDPSRKVFPKLVPIVSSGRVTKMIFQYWERHFEYIPDAVVLEGPMAGGHLGYKWENIEDPAFRLENLLPEVIAEVEPFRKKYGKDIPVIAGGGIYTGKDIYEIMKKGAAGVQMATRFVATEECDAAPEFKDMYIKCKKEDIMLIHSPVGLPGRAVRNAFLNDVEAGLKKPFKCPWKCLRTCEYQNVPYCIALALTNAKLGKLENGFAFTGANAYRIDRIMKVQELVDSLEKEYSEAAG